MISKKKNGIMIYTVSPYISEQQALELIGTFSKNAHNYFIINHDADVFTEDGKLILRFRKNVLTKSKLDIAYGKTQILLHLRQQVTPRATRI